MAGRKPTAKAGSTAERGPMAAAGPTAETGPTAGREPTAEREPTAGAGPTAKAGRPPRPADRRGRRPPGTGLGECKGSPRLLLGGAYSAGSTLARSRPYV